MTDPSASKLGHGGGCRKPSAMAMHDGSIPVKSRSIRKCNMRLVLSLQITEKQPAALGVRLVYRPAGGSVFPMTPSFREAGAMLRGSLQVAGLLGPICLSTWGGRFLSIL